jgi:hypothetical protein
MSEMKSRKKEHEAIVAAVFDLDRMGYLVSGICFKNGALEVIFYPPGKEDNGKQPDNGQCA